MRLAALRQKNGLILHDADSLCDAPGTHQMDPALFTTEYWREQGLIVGEAPGRGSSLFLQATPTEQWVLRPYRRGGMAAKLSEKRYLWCLGQSESTLEKLSVAICFMACVVVLCFSVLVVF